MAKHTGGKGLRKITERSEDAEDMEEWVLQRESRASHPLSCFTCKGRNEEFYSFMKIAVYQHKSLTVEQMSIKTQVSTPFKRKGQNSKI